MGLPLLFVTLWDGVLHGAQEGMPPPSPFRWDTPSIAGLDVFRIRQPFVLTWKFSLVFSILVLSHKR